jgi:hypothetical protein
MVYVALILSVAGILMAWNANRKNKDLQERLSQANSRVYNLRRDMQEQQESTDKALMLLKFELLKSQGDLKISPDMRVGEVLLAHPQAGQVLAAFHIGGCSSCSVDDRQTLGEAIAVNGRDLEPILAALNTMVVNEANGNGNGALEPAKLPNIELHI